MKCEHLQYFENIIIIDETRQFHRPFAQSEVNEVYLVRSISYGGAGYRLVDGGLAGTA